MNSQAFPGLGSNAAALIVNPASVHVSPWANAAPNKEPTACSPTTIVIFSMSLTARSE